METIKKLMLAAVILISMAAGAQVSVNVNIQAQPLWGPVGYDYVSYYYLPEYDLYYNVPARRYVYFDGGRWLFAAALPPRFATVNLYSTYKVVLTEPRAYKFHKTHVIKYKGAGGPQVIIKNSNEPKYYVVKGHPHYAPPGQVKKVSNVQRSAPAPRANPSYKSSGHGGGAPKGNGGGGGKGHGGGGGKGHGGGGGKGKH